MVLPVDDRVAFQVLDIAVVLERRGIVPEHPADMRVVQAASGGVGILILVVDVAVMLAVIRAPFLDGILQRQGAAEGEQETNQPVGFIGPV